MDTPPASKLVSRSKGPADNGASPLQTWMVASSTSIREMRPSLLAKAMSSSKAITESGGPLGQKDRAAICEAVSATRDFDGALGKWSFDENGDTSLTTMSGNTVKDGRFEFVKLLGGE